MCGLTGGWSRKDFPLLQSALPRMSRALQHRGPDDADLWCDDEAGIALAHNRLSIVDLSAAGRQPMASASGRWVIVYNGEIYNHGDVRRDLESEGAVPAWRGHSDTETLLAAVERWGVEESLRRATGMFAFALWDRSERCLWLARDRFGEKPLYYGWQKGAFLFASELKALRAYPGFNAVVDRQALALYLRHNAVPAPFSIYQGIGKLLPGHWLKLSSRHLETGSCPDPQPYWLAADVVARQRREAFAGTEAEATDALDGLLTRAIGRQMVADVPLGAFLSGGVDSSVVVSLMQAQSAQPVRTFSIGFHEADYNEAEHAAAVARHLGTDHTELFVSPDEAMAVIPELPLIYDEPFADPSQIPTSLVARLARRQVTVALSGDGGDELFGGYARYFMVAGLWKNLSRIPRTVRRMGGQLIRSVPEQQWDRLYAFAQPLMPAHRRWSHPGDRLYKGADVILAEDGVDLCRQLTSLWSPPDLLEERAEPARFGPPRQVPGTSLFEHMMLDDACHYMADDILVKVDRAAMASSLETRVPLLDHSVFEFAWSLPHPFKVRDGVGKYILRQLLYRYVPAALIDRPKRGFSVPLDQWLRGPLKAWAAELLDPVRIRQEGYFDPQAIQQKWREHQSGTRNWQHQLWTILMFQSWLEALD
ncbi:asparagine synthase (glutamine-hydrolyzing) [Sphingobium bisphenolivorans]|uniref:asparagine synthase (glutamine-hydrolyzing) n=1 Tax=Sphingobium bisphenolivorans TaxID=1335760 RepID=UPI00039B7B2A|nr:asparagine synthase (glutamine-hydrolyzing) [Sphingobium bisphenolivorans]